MESLSRLCPPPPPPPQKKEKERKKEGGESGYHIGLGNRGNTKQGVIGRRPVEGTANEGGGREEVRSKNGILIFYILFLLMT